MTIKRIRRGFTAVLFYQAFTFVEALGFVPLYLHAWGNTEYGHWLTLTAFLSYIMLLNLGGQEYIANIATMAYANHDYAAFKRCLSEGISLFAVICGGTFIVLTILCCAIFLVQSRGITTIELGTVLILWLIGTSYLLSIFGGVFATTYRAVGSYARGMNIGNVWSAIRLIVLSVALILHVPSTTYALLILIIACVRTIYGYFDLWRIVPEFRELHINLRMAAKGRPYLNGSLLFWGIAIAGALNFQGTLLVISANFVPAAVVLFSTHRTAANLTRYPFTMLQGPTLPEVSRLWAEKDYPRLSKLITTSVRINSTVTGLLAVALWIWLPVIYELWTGRSLLLNPLLLALLLVQNALYCGWATTGWLLLATNHHKLIALLDLLNACTTIFLATILVPIWGLPGVVLASLIGDIVFGLVGYPILLARMDMIKIMAIYRLVASGYLLPIIAGVFTIFVELQLKGILYLLITNVFLLAVSITAFRMLLDESQIVWIRQQILLRYRRLFPRSL